MSHQFLQCIYYLNDEQDEHSHSINVNISGESELKDKIHPKRHNALLVPKIEDDKNYSKGIMECMANAFKEVADSLNQKDPIPEDIGIMLKRLANTIQWIVNCTSWNNNKLEKFDLIEIKRQFSILGK